MPAMGHISGPELETGRVWVLIASPDFKYMVGETLTLEDGMGQRPRSDKDDHLSRKTYEGTK